MNITFTNEELIALKNLIENAKEKTPQAVKYRSALREFNETRRQRCKMLGLPFHNIEFYIKHLAQKELAEKLKETKKVSKKTQKKLAAEEKRKERAAALGLTIEEYKDEKIRSRAYQKLYYNKVTKNTDSRKAAHERRVKSKLETAKRRDEIAKRKELRKAGLLKRKPISEETRKRLSETMKARWENGLMSRKFSQERREKLSEAHKKNWTDPCFRYRRFGELINGMQKSRVEAAKSIVSIAEANA